MGFSEFMLDGNYLGSSGWRRLCGCDSAMGGILPQNRGESLVFGETEGEFWRERDLGCSSENGVSIFGYMFGALATECRMSVAASKCV